MSVHYKFKSALEYDTVTFDGLHISVKDLKKAILHQKKIGKTIDFDLQITNAQTKETYTNEDALISKNTSLIVARVPLTQQQRKQWESKQAPGVKQLENTEQSSLSQVDISSLDLSEEDKIKTMMSQSTSDYDPSNYVKLRGSNQVGTVPASYICFKCHQRGHWIKDCPFDGSNLAAETIKKSTGIPRSFMIEVEGPQVPGARMTPSGVYAVPAIDHEVYKEKKIEKPPFLTEKPAKETTIPEDLICGICKDLLQDAVMVPCCGISFCDECIRNYLVDSEESECPDCNEKEVSPDTLIPNRFLRNNVNTFKNETGYIKVKPQIIQQRPPTPPRPSLPDFIPPPEYVESTAAENQSSTKTDKSPIFQESPSSLQILPSPPQSNTTPLYSEQSPIPDGSNSQVAEDLETCVKSPSVQNDSYFSAQNSNKDSHTNGDFHSVEHYNPVSHNERRFPGRRTVSGGGHFRNFRYPPPRYSSHFSEPKTVIFPPMRRTQGYGVLLSDQKGRDGKGYQNDIANQQTAIKEIKPKPDVEEYSLVTSLDAATVNAGENDSVDVEKMKDKKTEINKIEEENEKEKLKRAVMDVDDVSSVSSNTSEEPPPPVEDCRANEGHSVPSQFPSYAIPSLFSGLHPITLPPPVSDRYVPSHPAETFLSSQSDSGEERSSTPTVDEVMEIPPLRPPFDPYRPPNYGMPYYDQHYSVPPSFPIPYEPNVMYDRSYRGFSKGPRLYRGRSAIRQPPPPGSRPITPPRNEEEAYLAFQRMLKEKEERDKRKNEKIKSNRRSTSRSRSRSAIRSRRSFSGIRSRSRTRSRTPARRTRSRSKKRSYTRSRSFVISRSRSRSYSRSPLHERNYSPRKYSPRRSPLRYDRFDSGYGQWNQDHREYRRGGYRSRGRKRFYNKSPPRGHDNPPYNRYRDENYMTSPRRSGRSHRSQSRYYDHRVSPKFNAYPRDSRDRDYRSGERETESIFTDRNIRRRSHSNSVLRNNFNPEKNRDRNRESDRDRDRYRDRERARDRDNGYQHRSRSRRSGSRRYSPAKKSSAERTQRSKEKSPDIRQKNKETRNRSRERQSYDCNKEKRKYSRERNRSKEYEKEKRHGRSRERSRSREKRKRSPSWDKRKRSSSSNRKRRTPSRHRSFSRTKEEKRRSHSTGNRSSRSRHRARSESADKDRKRSISGQRQEGTTKKSDSPVKVAEPSRAPSPKVSEIEEDEKKEKKKEKEKKKKKKEKETEEERAARKKKKKEKKEEKKRKQELKVDADSKDKSPEEEKDKKVEKENSPSAAQPEANQRSDPAPNFVSTFIAVEDSETKITSTVEENSLVKPSCSEGNAPMPEGGPVEYNAELELHTSYDSLLEDPIEKEKKGILAQLPEKSKWELDENQVPDSNPKQNSSDSPKDSPEFAVKVTREVIKRAENAIFKRAVNAIREREPSKMTNDKEERKDRKLIVTPEKDRSSTKESRAEMDGDKTKRVFSTRDKEKLRRNSVEINKMKTEMKRTVNSLQITIPIGNENESNEEGKGKASKHLLCKKDENQKSPQVGRISVKERLGSKIEKSNRNVSPTGVHSVEKRARNADEDSSEMKTARKDYQIRSTLSSTIESIDSKRATIDEVHFVPNYDESSDEEENVKSRHASERDGKQFSSNGSESKKRGRSSSESVSEESTKKHKKKKSKSKKKKQKRSKKHVSESSDSSDSEREKKRHKKSKKKKKSKH